MTKFRITLVDEELGTTREACARVMVLQPEWNIARKEKQLFIDVPDSTNVNSARQLILDQLLRSRYAEQTLELRELLYRRLFE